MTRHLGERRFIQTSVALVSQVVIVPQYNEFSSHTPTGLLQLEHYVAGRTEVIGTGQIKAQLISRS
jgi:hypothetical protein